MVVFYGTFCNGYDSILWGKMKKLSYTLDFTELYLKELKMIKLLRIGLNINWQIHERDEFNFKK